MEVATVVRHLKGITGVERLERLQAAYAELDAEELVAALANSEFPGETAVTSSFGTESAVLLHLVARVDRSLPILFLQTGMLFEETISYVNELTERLALTNVRFVEPDATAVARSDPDRDLWITAPDRCCYIRKVRPFRAALAEFSCWVTGLKRSHGGARGDVQPLELEEGRIKVNPLAHWTNADIQNAFSRWSLPRHPLASRGYMSVGCIPCTAKCGTADNPRDGRWRNRAKTECGIHSRLAATSSDDHST